MLPLDHYLCLQLTLDLLDFEQEVFCLDDPVLRLLGHHRQVREVQLDLRRGIDRYSFLVFLEQQLQLRQFHLQDLDVVDVFVALFLELSNFSRQLPFVLLAVLDHA